MLAISDRSQFPPVEYRRFLLKGSPADLGQAQAVLLKPMRAIFRPSAWEHDTSFIAQCAAILRGVAPRLHDEIAAFADAMDVPMERALFLRAGSYAHGCSAFAWQCADGRVIAGRNYDFFEGLPTRHLYATQPTQGFGHVGMNGGLVGGRNDGLNERGVFVALHKVMANRPLDLKAGIPFHLVLRIVLEHCATAAEAVELICSLPHFVMFNYTVADAQGNFFAVETYPGLPSHVRQREGSIAVANHYESEDLRPLHGQRKLGHSHQRVAAMIEPPAPWEDPWEAAKELLSSHRYGMCGHREFNTTLWSGIFDLTNVRAAYAFGQPCITPYDEIEVPRVTIPSV